MLSAVIFFSASVRARSVFTSGERKAMRTVPSFSLPISASLGRWTLATSSASNALSTICAPAFSYASSGNAEATPAPRSTMTVFPALARRPTVSGTSPTRVSPGMDSFGTPIFIGRRKR